MPIVISANSLKVLVLEFSLKLKMMGSNSGYLLKFLLYVICMPLEQNIL